MRADLDDHYRLIASRIGSTWMAPGAVVYQPGPSTCPGAMPSPDASAQWCDPNTVVVSVSDAQRLLRIGDMALGAELARAWAAGAERGYRNHVHDGRPHHGVPDRRVDRNPVPRGEPATEASRGALDPEIWTRLFARSSGTIVDPSRSPGSRIWHAGSTTDLGAALAPRRSDLAPFESGCPPHTGVGRSPGTNPTRRSSR